MARIKDVAKEAGVAPSTVSLVLNHKGYVSEATREKVEAAVKKLNYVPSEVARNLSLSRTNTIGVIVPSVSHPFFAELTEELEEALFALGYKTMICSTRRKENAEQTFIDMLKRKTMDGIIMGAHSLDVSIYQGVRQPIIAFDRYINDAIPIVHCDHEAGGHLAASAFLRHDCHHIVEMVGDQAVKSPANRHHEVLAEDMREQGIPYDIFEMKWNAFGYRDFLEAARVLFVRYPDVDGIIGSDVAIAACQYAAAEKGRKVPDDLRMLAYDGTGITRIGVQPVTAVRQPIAELARLAARKIVNRVNGVRDGLPWTAKPVLLEGETC